VYIKENQILSLIVFNFSTMPIIKEGERSLDYLLLTKSLLAALQHPNSVDDSWMNEDIKDLCQFKLSGDGNSAYWIDNDGGKLCLSFPAILDMKGKYSRFDPYFSLMDSISVCFF
jgi:hypothetical protein